MGTIHIDLFMTLDGVAQAPGGPEEDTDRKFEFGGWQAPLIDEVVGAQVDSGMAGMDALLLGRKTHEIFAGYWPHQPGRVADLLNRLPKYVASHAPLSSPWAATSWLGPDPVEAVRSLRQRHREIHVIGSLDFVQTLFAEKLFDQLNLWIHPVLLGQGKRVFAEGVTPTRLRLVPPVVASPKGTVLQRYALLEGRPEVGTMAP